MKDTQRSNIYHHKLGRFKIENETDIPNQVLRRMVRWVHARQETWAVRDDPKFNLERHTSMPETDEELHIFKFVNSSRARATYDPSNGSVKVWVPYTGNTDAIEHKKNPVAPNRMLAVVCLTACIMSEWWFVVGDNHAASPALMTVLNHHIALPFTADSGNLIAGWMDGVKLSTRIIELRNDLEDVKAKMVKWNKKMKYGRTMLLKYHRKHKRMEKRINQMEQDHVKDVIQKGATDDGSSKN